MSEPILGQQGYDFFRCYDCKTLFTADQVSRSLHTGEFCPCGSRKIKPSGVTFREYVLPNVMTYGVKKFGLAGLREDFLFEMNEEKIPPDSQADWLRQFDAAAPPQAARAFA